MQQFDQTNFNIFENEERKKHTVSVEIFFKLMLLPGGGETRSIISKNVGESHSLKVFLNKIKSLILSGGER